jgi:hypothetical protein
MRGSERFVIFGKIMPASAKYGDRFASVAFTQHAAEPDHGQYFWITPCFSLLFL